MADLDDLPDAPPPYACAQLYGHTAVQQQFIQHYQNNTLHHAWLLAGPQGIGKASLAYILATHILGQGAAQNIHNGGHPNLFVLKRELNDKGTASSVITVVNVRNLNGFLHTTAAIDGWRVVIIDSIDAMNRSAANALLKSLEEPPANVVFLIICHNLGALLPTIRSRVQIHKLKPLDDEDVMGAITSLFPDIIPSDLHAIVPLAHGIVRAACQLLIGQGGSTIRAIEDELTSATWPRPNTFKLLAQIADKNSPAQWQMLYTTLQQHLQMAAYTHIHNLSLANAIAVLTSDITETFAQADEYNLDKQGIAFSVLQKARNVLASA